MGEGENAGYQHLLLFQLYFQKAPFLASLKSGLFGQELTDDKIQTGPN